MSHRVKFFSSVLRMSQQEILPPSKHWDSLKRYIAEQRKKENIDYFRNLPCIKKSGFKLKLNQLRIVEHLFKHSSLLVIHRTGFGSLSAITTSQCLLNARKVNQVIVVSLKKNFKDEIINYGGDRNYKFYTYTKFAREYGNSILNEDLANTFLIIDEAHNLSSKSDPKNPIPTSRKVNSESVKQIILAAKASKKVMLLTATPVINSPSDIANLMEMLNPKPLDITSPKLFFNPIIFRKIVYDKQILDEELFNEFFSGKILIEPGFSKVDEVIKRLPMTQKFYKEYYRQQRKLRPDLIVDYFYSDLRQSCNILDGISPKITFILKKLRENKRSVVHSNFVRRGIEVLGLILKKNGIRYVTITGKMSESERKKATEAYNSGEVNVILFSNVASEIELKNTKYIFIMEPNWNLNRIEQMKARAPNFYKVYSLILEKPKRRFLGDNIESVDNILEQYTKERQKEIDAFMKELKRVSI